MTELADFRHAKDHFMRHEPQSPLTEEQKQAGQGLVYYDENPALRFDLRPEKHQQPERVEMQTSTGDIALFLRWGNLSFDVDGEAAQLTVYKDPEFGDYFVPFADATSGIETYGAGRYLELKDLPDSRVILDFNYAYNPYCAYNDRWSCPLTPAENRLKVPIRASEKAFK